MHEMRYLFLDMSWYVFVFLPRSVFCVPTSHDSKYIACNPLRLCSPTRPAPPPIQTAETLCRGLPALAEYLTYVRGLGPGEPADYVRAELIFTEGLRRRGFSAAVPFDWMIKQQQQAPHHHHSNPLKSTAAAAAAAAAAGVAGSPHGVIVHRRLGVAGASGGSPTGSGGGGSFAGASKKRPRAGSEDGSATAVFTNGRSGGDGGGGGGGGRGFMPAAAAAAGLFDLYADIPPPPDEETKTGAVSNKSGEGTPGGKGQEDEAGKKRSPTDASTATAEGSAALSLPAAKRLAATPGDRGIRGQAGAGGSAEAAARAVAGAAGAATTRNGNKAAWTGTGNAAVAVESNEKGGTAAAAAVDVVAALAKLRPHLSGAKAAARAGGPRGKKFPRACALLTDLLYAKLGPENEEAFFGVVLDAVTSSCGGGGGGGGAGSSSGSGAGEAVTGARKGSTPGGVGGGDAVVAEAGGGRQGETLRTLRRVGGVEGEALRRLVAAAGSRSSIFSGRRREMVEAWAKEADGGC